ncbi:MAG: NAD(P)-dependent oxidoreductase [Bacteroidales bacterium]
MKILIATEKPFAKAAVDSIGSLIKEAGHTMELLEKYTSPEQLYNAVSDVDALIVRSDKVTKEVIEAAKKLKIVVRAGAGYDNLDLDACTKRGIIAMNTPGQNSNAVAELAIGMMIYMARNAFTPGTGSELKGKTVGLHAYGHVGSLVAKLAKGFEMEACAFVRDPRKYHLDQDGVQTATSVEELYEKSDFISIHIPATAQTKGFIGKNLLERLPKGACIVNTARKEVINEPELIEVLEKRPDLKYITDVATENHAVMVEKFGNRVFAPTKKMGAQTSEANINAGVASAKQIIEFFKSGDTTFQVNK